MSKARATTGTDGLPLPILPPERDARVWARLVRVMFYTPGFLALLLMTATGRDQYRNTCEYKQAASPLKRISDHCVLSHHRCTCVILAK